MATRSLIHSDFFFEIVFDKDIEEFLLRKLKNKGQRSIIYKQIAKIICDPERQKPLKRSRKGLREVYIGSYRLYYEYSNDEETIYFVELSHKDKQ